MLHTDGATVALAHQLLKWLYTLTLSSVGLLDRFQLCVSCFLITLLAGKMAFIKFDQQRKFPTMKASTDEKLLINAVRYGN